VVIVYGGVRVDPAQVAEVSKAAREFESKCRAEAGCIEYILAWHVAEPNRIQLLEAWESEEASETHRAKDHVKEWAAFIASASIEAPVFSQHSFD
jgi:quinol monooxygenase YgiN